MRVADSCILVYAHDPREPERQRRAIELIRSLQDDGVLLWQTACEYIVACRKLEEYGFGIEAASRDVDQLRETWDLALPTWATLDHARELRERYSLSFWDSLIVALSLELGVEVLYTDDFDGYPEIDGMKVINPFRDEAEPAGSTEPIPP
jgi:predicted nucleic acid-binding protein